MLLALFLLIGGGASTVRWLRSPDAGPGKGIAGVAAAKNAFALSASPANLNVPAGTQGSFAVTISRTSFAEAVGFSIANLPPKSTATFAPASTSGTSSTLYIATSPDTKLGSYNPVITGTSAGGATASATVHVTVSAGQSKQFTISGTLDRALAPGVTGNLDLALTNPNNQPMTVTGLTVAIASVSNSGCTAGENYSVRQFTGSVTVPANATRTLSALGVTALPQITMVDLPVNQDVCKGVTLALTYTGTGTGA